MNKMNKKILAIFVCVAMLVSSLTVFAYAASIDVEIDLSGLFDEEPEEENKEEESESGSESGSNTGNGSNNGSNSGSNNGSGSGNNKPSTGSTDTEKEEEKSETPVTKDETPETWSNPFKDVKSTDWYYNTVKYVYENGIINGMTEDTFAPNTTLTRAMLVTILYRSEGSPKVTSSSKFSDVKNTDWYGAAVIWASENGIVNGVSETSFAPNNAITREQIATIMYRYAQANDYDVSVGLDTNILSYDDVESISEYAFSALQYTAGAGIMSGKTASTLNPQDKATRAEAATVVMRFIEYNN